MFYFHNDVTVELSNTQLALQGTDTKGFVMITSTMSRILNYEHKPQWREGDLRIKKSWVAKVEEMQVSKFVNFMLVPPYVCVIYVRTYPCLILYLNPFLVFCNTTEAH